MSLHRLLMFLLPLLFFSQSSFAADRQTLVVDAVAKARAAVVNIRTEKLVQRRNSPFFGFGDSIFDQFFRDMLPPRSYKTQSLGSGVIIDAEGHILTNAHVVDKASKIYIALSDTQLELEAELIGKDNRIDLAILKIVAAGEYPFLPPGRSDDLMLGETIIAIGNPLGLGHSITTGIISSLKRRIQLDQSNSSVFIQTDALINPGNSGGPLININGELIGINTAIARQAQGIGFSVPIDTAKRVLGDLITFGRVRRGFLGMTIGSVSPSFVRSYGEGGVLIE
ncbi:MAG: trypsin-like peptidase domain-containing protein, partial [Desulfuromusa sp.]|nr:trypsin-like peptidase domain-containing protein [Desulfuromusa sp.]